MRDYDRYGMCLSLGDWNRDVCAVSVPMVAADGNKVVAFSCTTPAGRSRAIG